MSFLFFNDISIFVTFPHLTLLKNTGLVCPGNCLSEKRSEAVLRDSPLGGFPDLKELSRVGVSLLSHRFKKPLRRFPPLMLLKLLSLLDERNKVVTQLSGGFEQPRIRGSTATRARPKEVL